LLASPQTEVPQVHPLPVPAAPIRLSLFASKLVISIVLVSTLHPFSCTSLLQASPLTPSKPTAVLKGLKPVKYIATKAKRIITAITTITIVFIGSSTAFDILSIFYYKSVCINYYHERTE
jgi:hypothetical protein